MKKILSFCIVIVAVLSLVITASAQAPTLESLQAEIEALKLRVEALESRLTPGVVQSTYEGAEVTSSGATDTAIGDYDVKVNRFVLGKDYEGKDAITIYFDFTNNSTETKNFMFAISDKAFQNGVQLETAIIWDVKSNSLTDIRPGVTIDAASSFLLTDTTSPVELELSEAFSWSSDAPILYVLDLAQASAQ